MVEVWLAFITIFLVSMCVRVCVYMYMCVCACVRGTHICARMQFTVDSDY